MKFREFNSWCNNRAQDGHWGLEEAITCCDVNRKIRSLPFWKREKYWKQHYEKFIVERIIEPTNQLIIKYMEENKRETIQDD